MAGVRLSYWQMGGAWSTCSMMKHSGWRILPIWHAAPGDAPPTTPCGAAKINHYMLCHYGLWILVRLKDDTTTYWVVTFADEVTPREHFDP